MRCGWKWVVLWSLWAARLVRQPTAPRRVSGGLLRGSVAPDGSHEYYLGVPYATLGPQHRFQAPGPQPHWEGIMDAYEENIRCSQRYPQNRVSGREDCLTLNVYTPLPEARALYPVMVFIHGGGFRDGSGSPFVYGPDYLIKHDVILVTFNYRLEILGFLCLGIEEAPGNAGLKDQVAALRWVKHNIKSFGGDPDNVTIFGESAGSAAVMYHLLSPMSRGLFHKAIMQSGSAISPWSFQFEPLKTASMVAKQMGYNTEDAKEIYKIFMSKSPEELLSTRIPRADGDVVLSENIFVPCLEKKLPGIEQFLSGTPYNLITKGQYARVPVLMGYNNEEGYFFVGKENKTMLARFDFTKALPRDLLFPTEKDKSETAEILKQLYMGDKSRKNKDTTEKDEKTRDQEKLLKLSRFEGETGITYPVIATIELLLGTNDKAIYTYKLCYDGWLNLCKLLYGFWGSPGATHADDLFYMFKPKITLAVSFFETEIINKITTMWTNFAKYGNPTPESSSLLPIKWPKTDAKDPRVLVIDKEFSTAPLWDQGTLLFWKAIYSKFRRKV